VFVDSPGKQKVFSKVLIAKLPELSSGLQLLLCAAFTHGSLPVREEEQSDQISSGSTVDFFVLQPQRSGASRVTMQIQRRGTSATTAQHKGLHSLCLPGK